MGMPMLYPLMRDLHVDYNAYTHTHTKNKYTNTHTHTVIIISENGS